MSERFARCPDVRDVASLQVIIRRIGDDAGPIAAFAGSAANDGRHEATQVALDDWNARIAVNLRPPFFAADDGRMRTAQNFVVVVGWT